MKSIYVADLKLGQTFTGVFAVSCSVTSSPKTSWLDVTASDKTGTIRGKRWGARGAGVPAKGFDHPYAEIVATVEDYPKGSGNLQLNIASLTKFDPAGDVEDFEPAAALSFNALRGSLDRYIGCVKNDYLGDILRFIFSNENNWEFQDAFNVWPAAVGMHHAVKHGLLQHTVEVASAVSAICATQNRWGYKPLDHDLAVTGALLHDIGKVEEMGQVGSGYEFSLGGGFEGHIVVGWAMVQNAITQTNKVHEFREDFPELLALKLKHIILSHHGTKEFGSPVEPQIPEAEVVNLCDVLSARLYMYANPENKPPLGSSFAKSFGLGHRMFVAQEAVKPSPLPPPRPRVPAGATFEPQDEIALDDMRERSAAKAKPAPAKPTVSQSAFTPAERTLFGEGVRHNADGEEDHFGS